VTDLLLQACGFQVIVLDLADIAPQHVTRIPLATWFRFRAAAEQAQCALLVLTQHPATGSSNAMLLRLEGAGELPATTYFPGLRFSAELARQRFASRVEDTVPLRKPPHGITAAEWSARTYWAGRP
jgi:recombination protein RecA